MKMVCCWEPSGVVMAFTAFTSFTPDKLVTSVFPPAVSIGLADPTDCGALDPTSCT